MKIFKTIHIYSKFLGAFFKASLEADLEFRINFLFRVITDIIWYLAQIMTFSVLFTQTQTLGGWGKPEMMVFLGVLFIVDSIYMILFSENLDSFSEKIRKGDLDLVLAKPVNSQFMMSFQRISTAYFANFIMAAGWLTWSLVQLPGQFPWERLPWLLVLIPSGIAVFYTCRFLFSMSALLFTRAENIQYLWFQLYRLGMRPDNFYRPWLRYFVLFGIPVAVIGSIPARSILFPPNISLFLWSIFISSASVYLTNILWKKALKKYASASS